METWYRMGWDDEITEVKPIKVTDKTLFVKGERWGKEVVERMLKRTSYANYFPTKEEAIAYRRSLLEARVENERNSLTYVEGKLAEFNEKYPKGE